MYALCEAPRRVDSPACTAFAHPVAVASPPPAIIAPPLLAYTQVPAGPGYATVLPDLDFEAYSEAGYWWDGPAARWRGVTKTDPGLAAVGAAVYTEHPSCMVLSLAYDLKDGRGDRLWTPGMAPPQDLFGHIAAGGLLEAWNSGFEYWMWRNVCNARMGWPELPHTQLRCAMAKSRAHSLPGALEAAAKAINASEQKDKGGKALITKLCIPKSPSKKQVNTMPAPLLLKANHPTPMTHPLLYNSLYEYCKQDIKAEAAISLRCPDLSERELQLWLLDQAINFRGVHIDQAALYDCIAIVQEATVQYTTELQMITQGAVGTASELAVMLRWLGTQGLHLPNIDSDMVEATLKRTDITPLCRRVLEIRDSLGSASVKKLFAIQRRLSRAGRLHDLFAYAGADRTARWAGRGPQPQNLPSSGPKVCECTGCGRVFWKGLLTCPECGKVRGPDDACDWGIKAVDACLRDIATRSLTHVEAMWGDALGAVAGCLRGLFAAAPGCEFICSDFSAIEAVVLAELAGEEWRQEVFRTHGKIYEAGAAKICGIPLEEFFEYKKRTGMHHPMRKKIGKVSELASGFGGGWGAWVAFGADEYMTEEEGKANIYAWREASPAIAGRKYPRRGQPEVKGFWYGLQDAAFAAVASPGYCFTYQAPATRFGQPPPITYGVKDDILYCLLPSGRMLTYHTPRLEQKTGYNGRTDLALTYWGYNTDYKKGPKGWMKLDTWGGKLTENVVQAVARDILAHAMPGLEAAGYPIVLHVHDEVVSEVLAGTGSIEEFERIMGTMPPWAAGWPIKAAGGWRGARYRKD